MAKKNSIILGIGGGGQNIVNYLQGKLLRVDMICVNSDEQILKLSKTQTLLLKNRNSFTNSKLINSIIELFSKKQSLGCGGNTLLAKALVGKQHRKIKKIISNYNQVILISTFGGGFGTGATPTIAKLAKELDLKITGIVTIPFSHEGITRKNIALAGIQELKQFVDKCIVLDNQELVKSLPGNTSLKETFNIISDKIYGICKNETRSYQSKR